jgi:sugar (pentulose or hexulose) kinase
MGGREFAAVAGPDDGGVRAEAAAVAALAVRGTLALPGFGPDHGQFPGSAGRGRIVGPPPEGPVERRSLAVLYAALLTAACADVLGGGDRLVLDGGFLAEPLFASLVAALRPGVPTEASAEPAGVMAGAALLAARATGAPVPPARLDPVAPPPGLPTLAAYAARWRALAAG